MPKHGINEEYLVKSITPSEEQLVLTSSVKTTFLHTDETHQYHPFFYCGNTRSAVLQDMVKRAVVLQNTECRTTERSGTIAERSVLQPNTASFVIYLLRLGPGECCVLRDLSNQLELASKGAEAAKRAAWTVKTDVVRQNECSVDCRREYYRIVKLESGKEVFALVTSILRKTDVDRSASNMKNTVGSLGTDVFGVVWLCICTACKGSQ
eukprot:1953917-Amphidinium_carterae.1